MLQAHLVLENFSDPANILEEQISDLYGSHHTIFGIIALITILIGECSIKSCSDDIITLMHRADNNTCGEISGVATSLFESEGNSSHVVHRCNG